MNSHCCSVCNDCEAGWSAHPSSDEVGSTTPKTEVHTMSQPKVEQAIQDLLNAVQNMQGSTVDESKIRRIATEVTTNKLVDTELASSACRSMLTT